MLNKQIEHELFFHWNYIQPCVFTFQSTSAMAMTIIESTVMQDETAIRDFTVLSTTQKNSKSTIWSLAYWFKVSKHGLINPK